MTLEALGHVWFADAADPLQKLILIRFADGCDGSGELHPADYVRFCCATEDEIKQAVFDLVADGLLIQLGPFWYSLAGYSPDRSHGRPPAYVKRKLSKTLKQQVFARDGHCCRTCGSANDLSVDHIHPEKHGGTDDLDNLQVLCRPCNSRKKDRVA